jgi:cation:H+ antiporter
LARGLAFFIYLFRWKGVIRLKGWIWIALAVCVTLPGLAIRFFGPANIDKTAPLLGAVAFGVAVLGAAFLLAWATEAAQHDVPAALAISVMALIAILPEYAVDYALTWEAATNPTYQEYAIANMIGANRMIVGFAWPLVVLIFVLKFRKRHIELGKEHRIEVGYLLIAGLYSIILPIKGSIDWYDMVFLVGLFAIYTIRLIKAEVHEPELIGPAKVIGDLPRFQRIPIYIGMIMFAGFSIIMVAKPFAQSLIQTGTQIGVDEVFLIKWFAPIASEAPEIVICVIFALRAMGAESLGTLVSSKVNQWTLLVGTLPLVFSMASGYIRALPLQGSFTENGVVKQFDLVGPMLTTSAQTLLAVMIVINLRAGLKGAGLLFTLLVAQFFFPNSEYWFCAIYLVFAVGLAIKEREQFIPTFKSMFSPKYVREQTHSAVSEPVGVTPEKVSARS